MRRFHRAIIARVIGLGPSACGGGSAVLAPPPSPASTPPVGIDARTYALKNEAAAYTLPAAGGVSGSIGLSAAAVAGGTTLELASSTEAPAGATTLGSAARGRPDDTGTLAVYFYAQARLSNTVAFSTLPSFSLTLPAMIANEGQQFYYAFSETGMGEKRYVTNGPATLSGRILTFAPTVRPLTLRKNVTYTFAFYTTATVPEPAPSGAAATRIYVANYGTNTLLTYGQSGAPAGITISGFHSVQSVAVDGAGKIYVLSSGFPAANDGTVMTYLPDGTPTTPVITGLNEPSGIAVDRNGKIYIAGSSDNEIETYTADGVRTTPTIPAGFPLAVTVDASGKIYVATGNVPGSLESFTATGVPTSPTVANFGNVYGIAVGANGKVYAADYISSTITTYDPDGSQSLPIITDGVAGPFALAIDGAGNVYVANNSSGTVTTYNAAGVRRTPTISGLDPFGIAVH